MCWVDRYAPVALTACLVVWLESFFTVEWTYPYCLDQADGPAYAAQGFPLPYWMWNGVVSLEHDFLPHIYVLDLIILFLLAFPFVRWLWNRAALGLPMWLKGSLAALGTSAIAVHVALTILMITMGWFQPAMSLEHSDYYRYSDLRPVRIGLYRSNAPDCTPSRFWFPNGSGRK